MGSRRLAGPYVLSEIELGADECLSASFGRPPTSACSSGSAMTIAGSTARSPRIKALDSEGSRATGSRRGRRDDADNDLRRAQATSQTARAPRPDP